MSQKHRRTAQRAQQWGARALAALVAFVTLLAVLRAGSSYVYCPSMQRVSDDACCAGDRHAHDEDSSTMEARVEVRSRDCCEQHVLSKLPSVGSLGAAPHLLASPMVAVLPAPTADAHRSAPITTARLEHEGRAGPLALARHRAELMVALN